MKYLTLLAGLTLLAVCICKPTEINEQNWENLLSKDEWMVEL